MEKIKEKFYSDPGYALQSLAVIIAILVTIGGIICGIILFKSYGLILSIFSPFIAYIISLPLYAFGELVENSAKIAENIASLQNQNTSIK